MVETSKYALFTVGTNSTQEAFFKVDDGMGTTGGTSVGGTLSIGAPNASQNASLVAFGSASNINLNIVPKGAGTLGLSLANLFLQGAGGTAMISATAGTTIVLAPSGAGTVALQTGAITFSGTVGTANIATPSGTSLVLAPGGTLNIISNSVQLQQASGTFVTLIAPTGIDIAILPQGTGLIYFPTPGTATTAASFTATKRIQFRDATGTTWYIPANGTAW